MTNLILLFAMATQTFQLPPGLLSSLCYVETHHNPNAVVMNDGGSPSRGVCQVKYNTAVGLGFKGSPKELQTPVTNVYYAGKYLRYQLDRYNGDIRKAVAAYNAGSHRVNAKGVTKNKKYVQKVFMAWTGGGSS